VSRIGRLPVDIPTGVQVELTGSKVRVKGPKGELHREFSKLIDIDGRQSVEDYSCIG
jgi:large subunit ribosomal protein L6